MTTIILIVVMLAAVVGMIVCNKKQETFAMAQPVAFVLLAVVIACGGYLIYDAFSDSDQAELIDRERRFSTSRGTVVAEYLKGKGINSVALLVEPKSAQSDFNVALVEAIKEAGIGTVEVIEIPARFQKNWFSLMLLSRKTFRKPWKRARPMTRILSHLRCQPAF